ncbi:hypothetical protein DW846_14635 [Ruminococcus sp. AM36-2AA]|nr:hypothetical protein DW851_14670 [Ruminococcus sp. AM36-5]RGH55177.1 hypothetical protein DW846_14635 [Ruminococcus sp. AM36-2AA]
MLPLLAKTPAAKASRRKARSIPPKGKKRPAERQKAFRRKTKSVPPKTNPPAAKASRPGRAKPTAKCVSRRAHNVQYLVQFYH